MSKRITLAALAILATLPAVAAFAEIIVRTERHLPANLFDVGTPISLNVRIGGLPGPAVKAGGEVRDYHGNVVWSGELPVRTATESGKAEASVSIESLPPGYYELTTRVASGESTGSRMTSFVVFPLVNRTAEEVREGGYRIGLKKWTHGPMSWHNNHDWSEHEATLATTKLGLQWTRDQFNWKSHQSVLELINNYPMNVILKIERFPKHLFDEDRYGPLDTWIKERKPAWQIYTVPKKEPYQAWLREELLKLPREQNVFEIWNEAYNGMSAEDFATICKYIIEVLKELRPDAVVGPNLSGAASDHGFDAKFIEAGGMAGMNMVALHPYINPPEGVREAIRKYRGWLTKKLGREVLFTVTEYGAPTHPKGGVTERQQAQYVTRQTLLMYAEDVKIMTPHWMGQTERDPTYREDWYGFYRANQEPKPSVIALATAARMIDASRYVGDLWFGPHAGASLFEKGGVHTLALWTNEGEQEIEIPATADALRLVDIVGGERTVFPSGGRLKLKIDENPRYLVGVDETLAARTTTELNPAHWPKPPVVRHQRVAARVGRAPAFDGKLDEWSDLPRFELMDPQVNGADASAAVFLGWDETYLYVGVDVRDNQVLNKNAGDTNTIYRGDSVEIFVSGTPKDDGMKGLSPNDYQIMVSPTSLDGRPRALVVTDPFGGKVSEIEGLRSAFVASARGWAAELAIPIKNLAGFPTKAGETAAFDILLNDADSTRSGRFKIGPADREGRPSVQQPSNWSLLKLGE